MLAIFVPETRAWQQMREMSARLLKERTGSGVDAWNRRIRKERLGNEAALRLEGAKPGGRLKPSKIQDTMPVQVGLRSPNDLDSEVLNWLQEAYEENR